MRLMSIFLVHFPLFLDMYSKTLRMMLSKKSLPVLISVALLGLFLTYSCKGNDQPGKYEKIFRQVAEMLQDNHFSPRKLDDNFSKMIFRKFLENIDPDKNIFLQSDIRELRKYENKIDDELQGAPITFFKAVSALYDKRMQESSIYYKDILSKPFSFVIDETVILDAEKLDWPSSEQARKESWRKKLKYMTLERYADLLEAREQNRQTAGYNIKSDTELEKDARDRVSTIISRNFERLRVKFTEEERFNMLVNTITTSMDPHTTFFPPIEKRYFDEQMSGRFFGIGASLRQEDGSIKIATLVTGSPAWKSQQITVGDIVMKVGQATDEPVDLTGFDTEDAVKLIRGKKGTEVKLTLKKADGSLKIVSLIRDEIVTEETFARSVVIQEQENKIGYIFLPEFYADWERPNGARSAMDVARELIKLREQKVDGIIIDLRNNGGGSLYDVVQMVGFFIEEGPIVQVKDREGNPNILRDRDRSVLYDGPLAVMVNEFSASASEIFAAAIQDYKRGLVVGSTSTYGKGTVQRNISLDGGNGSPFSMAGTAVELGTIKLTLQKFYRINGGSTQLKGVTPDIILPDQFEYLKYREKDNPDALPWDEIQKASFSPSKTWYDINDVVSKGRERVKNNSNFNAIHEAVNQLEKINDKVYSLKLEKYKAEQKQVREVIKKIDEVNKIKTELSLSLLPIDEKRLSEDKDKLERRRQWAKSLGKDIYLAETVNVVKDMIGRNTMVKK
jgi:carboxyl-terminal processing protease